jgi:tRNA(Ile)-lysidine synthetase-like protein
MKIDLPGGRYVVAVSGGVDSVVLLHMLAGQRAKDKGQIRTNSTLNPQPSALIIAHFDHGIRLDSVEDRKLVQKLAKQYGLPFVYDRAELGAGASEATAREARYAFLAKVKQATGADAIITAHHEDDVLETIIINWLRGTKSRGLSSLRSSQLVRRPLLGMTKKQIRAYARSHNLAWREDSTNADETYLRNYIRKHVVTKLDEKARAKLLEHSAKAAELNDAITGLVGEYLQRHTTSQSIDRLAYRELPKEVAREVLAEWLRRNTSIGVTTKLILRLDTAVRTGRNGSQVDIAKGNSLHLERSDALLQN